MNRKKLLLVLLAVTFAVNVSAASERTISIQEYRDKMEAGWIGQMAGVSCAARTEFKFYNRIIPIDEGTGLPELMPKWTPELINGAFGQDDLYVEMTFLRSLEEHDFDLSHKQAGLDFANTGYSLWVANAIGRSNLRMGIAPPDSGHPQFNEAPNAIDYQIEADYSGLIAPGLPQVPVDLGEKFGRMMKIRQVARAVAVKNDLRLVFPCRSIVTLSGSSASTGVYSVAQITDLRNGLHYVNIHSTRFGGGEIRGQLVPEPSSVLFGIAAAGLFILRRR